MNFHNYVEEKTSLYYDCSLYSLKESNDDVYFPMKVVMESMGYEVCWNKDKEINISNNYHKINLKVGEKNFFIDNNNYVFNHAPIILDANGYKTYVPLELLKKIGIRISKIRQDINGEKIKGKHIIYICGNVKDYNIAMSNMNVGIRDEVTRLTKYNAKEQYDFITKFLKLCWIRKYKSAENIQIL